MSGEHKSRLSQEWVIKAVREKYKESELGELVSVVCKPVGGEGVNFTSDVEKLDIIFNNKTNDKQIPLSLISKLGNRADCVKDIDVRDNKTEVEIYVNVLVEMEKVMVEFNDERKIFWPKLYGHIPYWVLLLEDVSRGAIPMDPRIRLTKDFALLGMETLGRYHAMSKILLQRGLVDAKYKNKYLFAKKSPFQEKLFDSMLQVLTGAMIEKEGHWKSVESSEEWGKRLQVLIPTFCDKREEAYFNYDERFEVLNHGDFRIANMTFLAEENTDRPTDMRVFDFQLPHINSFIWDVIYFLGNSVEPKCRRNCRSELVETYHRSLADNLKIYNFEGYIPTIDDVTKEINRVSLPQFISVVCVSPMFRTTEKVIDFEKLMTNPPEEVIQKSVYFNEQYVEEVIGDFVLAVDRKII